MRDVYFTKAICAARHGKQNSTGCQELAIPPSWLQLRSSSIRDPGKPTRRNDSPRRLFNDGNNRVSASCAQVAGCKSREITGHVVRVDFCSLTSSNDRPIASRTNERSQPGGAESFSGRTINRTRAARSATTKTNYSTDEPLRWSRRGKISVSRAVKPANKSPGQVSYIISNYSTWPISLASAVRARLVYP